MPKHYTREMARKWVHLLSLFFIVIYFIFEYIFDKKAGLLALTVLLAVLLVFEYSRLELKKKVPVISIFWWVKRKKEKEVLGSEILFLISSIICLAVFEYRIAVTAIIMTTFGDLAAALIGKKFGRHHLPFIKNKAWEGFLAELGINIIAGFLIMRTLVYGKIWWLGGGFGTPIWILIIPMAVTGAVIETAIDKLDDNLVVPIFTGLTGQIIFLLIFSA